jgi:hypothetical protein
MEPTTDFSQTSLCHVNTHPPCSKPHHHLPLKFINTPTKAESNRQCKCNFASPLGTVLREFPLQQGRQTRQVFCLRGERRCKNTPPLSRNAFRERRREASVARWRGACGSRTQRRSAGGSRAPRGGGVVDEDADVEAPDGLLERLDARGEPRGGQGRPGAEEDGATRNAPPRWRRTSPPAPAAPSAPVRPSLRSAGPRARRSDGGEIRPRRSSLAPRRCAPLLIRRRASLSSGGGSKAQAWAGARFVGGARRGRGFNELRWSSSLLGARCWPRRWRTASLGIHGAPLSPWAATAAGAERTMQMQMQMLCACWSRWVAKATKNTVDVRQTSICLPILHYVVGLSLRCISCYFSLMWCTSS